MVGRGITGSAVVIDCSSSHGIKHSPIPIGSSKRVLVRQSRRRDVDYVLNLVVASRIVGHLPDRSLLFFGNVLQVPSPVLLDVPNSGG